MPLLARMLAAPLLVDVRPGAVAGLGALLADRRIATSGRVAVAVGPGQGDSIAAELNIDAAEVFRVPGGGHTAAVELGQRLRAGAYEAVAGIGGGKVIDITKFAAHMAGIPMVAVATNLAHDGIASPVSSLEHESGKGSYGVAMPVAVVVDLDRVRQAPDPLGRAGIGDVALSSNEYKTAERLKKDYWLYVVFYCGVKPQAHVVQDPARLGWQPLVKIEHYHLKAEEIIHHRVTENTEKKI